MVLWCEGAQPQANIGQVTTPLQGTDIDYLLSNQPKYTCFLIHEKKSHK